MSYWVRPTTADVGIRAFGKNQNDLLREMTLGMQSILLAGSQDVNSIQRKVARWEISHEGDFDIMIVKWLDEVIYRAEVHEEFLLECQPMIRNGIIEAQVSYVSKDEVELEVVSAATPCKTISASFTDGYFNRISHKKYPGETRWYCKVLKEGQISRSA